MPLLLLRRDDIKLMQKCSIPREVIWDTYGGTQCECGYVLLVEAIQCKVD
jgi:hypothetical protein